MDNTSLDIRNLTNLENIQTLKKVKMKAKSSWIRKNVNNNNWDCIVSKDGVYQNIFKVKKSLAFSSIPCYTVGKASDFYSKSSVKFIVSINSYHSCF